MSALLILLFLIHFARSETSICSNIEPWWTTSNGNILLNGEHPFHIKGATWFGMETETNAPHGLWSLPLDHFVDFLSANQFNAVRLSFSVKNVLDNPTYTEVDCQTNPNICHLDYLDLMEHIVDELGHKGILVMLDQHRIDGPSISTLWYTEQLSESKILQSWDVLLSRFGRKWNVFALDLKNEPHGPASWGFGNITTDWNKAAERIIKHISDKHQAYQGLFFVQGVSENAATSTPNQFSHWWGGNLEGVRSHPISTGDPYRLVYSPHVYGPDVYVQSYFYDRSFPQNLPPIWEIHFGFVEQLTGVPVVIGEWGGHYLVGNKDRVWQNEMGKWMKDSCMSDNFYWCLNPNSGDTGGLLKDNWLEGREDKLDLLRSIQPHPSFLTKQRHGRFCLEPGAFANPLCADIIIQPTIPEEPKPAPPPTTTPPPKPETTTKAPPAHPNTVEDDATITVIQQEQWVEGDPIRGKPFTQIKIAIKNTGSINICGGSRLRSDPGNLKIRDIWNLEGRGEIFTLPHWSKIVPGGADSTAGMIYTTTPTLPTFTLISIVSC